MPQPEKPFIPLNQLGAYIAGQSTEQVLNDAEALYNAESTRAHYDNLVEARYDHEFATGKRKGRQPRPAQQSKRRYGG